MPTKLAEQDLETFLRPSVKAFALEMERRLRANDHKSGWQNMWPQDLLRLFFSEIFELLLTLKPPDCDKETWLFVKHHFHLALHYISRISFISRVEGSSNTLLETADVANYVMMISEVCQPKPAVCPVHTSNSSAGTECPK
jgi:hypothetical protein